MHILEQKTLNPEKVIRIEYWSNEEIIYSFESYDDFHNHWSTKKLIANPENEYRIYYDSGYIKRVKMKNLNLEEEIREFLF